MAMLLALPSVVVCLMLVGCADESRPTPANGEPETPSFQVDPSWPSIPNDWIFGITSGLAIDAEENIWVLQRPRTVAPEDADRAAPPVMVFDTDGNYLKSWGGPDEGYEWPATEHGIFVDHEQNVWISGSGQGDDQILKFTNDGDFLMQIGSAGQSRGNTDTENVNRAADLYVHASTNELFVADGYGNRRVIVFDAANGEFKRMWGAFGNAPSDPTEDEVVNESNPEHFSLVHGVKVSNDGLVYVADRRGMRLQVFTVDGRFQEQILVGRTEPDPAVLTARADEMAHGQPVADLITNVSSARQSVSQTAFSSDPEQRYLFMADRSNQEVVVLERESLTRLSAFGQTGDRPGEFYILHDMVSDAAGNLYTAEVNVGARAQKFNYVGTTTVSTQ
jgi:DNA-binding beta-propeller fold protein YncE